MPSNMILPVDGSLLAAMVKARGFIDTAIKRNDRKHYLPLVEALNGLTTSILRANTGSFLTVRQTIGARFDFGPGAALVGHVDTCVGYLRNVAQPIVSKGEVNLSQYEGNNASEAYGHLRALYELLTGSIEYMAMNDLKKVLDAGPEALVASAEFLYGKAHSHPKVEPEPVKPDWDGTLDA